MKFLKRRREERLYKQWVQHDGLPPESMPRREVAEDRRVGGERQDRLRPYKEKFVDIIRKLLKV
jgi:hypothetical protein